MLFSSSIRCQHELTTFRVIVAAAAALCHHFDALWSMHNVNTNCALNMRLMTEEDDSLCSRRPGSSKEEGPAGLPGPLATPPSTPDSCGTPHCWLPGWWQLLYSVATKRSET